MIAHINLSVLQAVSGRCYAGCLDRCFWGTGMWLYRILDMNFREFLY